MDKTAIDVILDAYREGKFPMADGRNAEDVYLYDPTHRALIPIKNLHISRSLKKAVRKFPFEIRVNTDFPAVIRHCAERTDSAETWINDTIESLFTAMHYAGHAHSVECWEGDELVGGLYGLALGGVFCGESMFSLRSNASKIALVHLCARLWHKGFTVLDAQYVNPHLEQFDSYRVTREAYLEKLRAVADKQLAFAMTDISEEELISAYFDMRKQLKSSS